MDTWERIARGIKKELAGTIRVEWDRKNKIARFYRTTYFTGRTKRGPVPFSPYEGKEEILVDGNEYTVIVKRMGLGYYRLNNAVTKNLNKLEIGWVAKDFSDDIEGKSYSWKND